MLRIFVVDAYANASLSRFDADCARVVEGNSIICEWCQRQFNSTYPLGHLDMHRSFTPGDVYRWIELSTKLMNGGLIEIAVIGGSMTFGVNCLTYSGKSAIACAWPARLETLLKDVFPYADIHVTNHAVRGWNYDRWITSGLLRTINADAYIIDLSVNAYEYKYDIFALTRSLDYFLHIIDRTQQSRNRTSAVLMVETFRTCACENSECAKHCSQDDQGYMRTHHLNVTGRYYWCNQWWLISDFEAPVISHYKLPVASYRSAVWPDISTPNQLLPCFWNGFGHCDATGHALVADTVAYAFQRMEMLARAQVNDRLLKKMYWNWRPPFHALMRFNHYCSDHAPGLSDTYLNVRHPEKFQPVFLIGNWEFKEDRPGKPGWIVNSSDVSVFCHAIGFNVNFSYHPHLEVRYLETYENIGSVNMVILQPNFTNVTGICHMHALTSFILDGLTKQHWSVPKLERFEMHDQYTENYVRLLPPHLGNGSYIVAFILKQTNQTTRFKLLGISSC